MNLRRMAAGLTLATAMTIGLSGGTAQAAAGQAAPGTATLRIVPEDNGYVVTVYGLAPSGGAGSVSVDLYGDETGLDEYLYGSVPGTSNPDGFYKVRFIVGSEVLDEDWGQDEIFAKVIFPGPVALRTNTVTGSF